MEVCMMARCLRLPLVDKPARNGGCHLPNVKTVKCNPCSQSSTLSLNTTPVPGRTLNLNLPTTFTLRFWLLFGVPWTDSPLFRANIFHNPAPSLISVPAGCIIHLTPCRLLLGLLSLRCWTTQLAYPTAPSSDLSLSFPVVISKISQRCPVDPKVPVAAESRHRATSVQGIVNLPRNLPPGPEATQVQLEHRPVDLN